MLSRRTFGGLVGAGRVRWSGGCEFGACPQR